VALAQRCDARNDELLAHIATADTARDLDHLRRLVGTGSSAISGSPTAPSSARPTPTCSRAEPGPWSLTALSIRSPPPLDPNTPLANARRGARRLGNAVLLTDDGYGHLSRRDPSTCVVQTTGRYLMDLTTPAPEPYAPLTASRSIPSSANHALDRVFIAATGCSSPVFILLAQVARKSPGQGDACLVTWL
jgi:hypothetical protein